MPTPMLRKDVIEHLIEASLDREDFADILYYGWTGYKDYNNADLAKEYQETLGVYIKVTGK